jgi:hypothetical protein
MVCWSEHTIPIIGVFGRKRTVFRVSTPYKGPDLMPLPNNTSFCNAHNRDGSTCTNVVVKGMAKCRMHGGKSLAGMANGNYRSGRYSKHLPVQMAQRAEEARTNPRLLSLSDDIAVLEARLAERFRALEQDGSATVWPDLQATWRALHEALKSGNGAGVQAAEREMERLLTVGGSQAAAWAEISELMLTRAKLTQVEVKTFQTLQQMITAQQHQLAMGAIMQAVIEAVQAHAETAVGRAILRDVGTEMTRLSTLEARR